MPLNTRSVRCFTHSEYLLYFLNGISFSDAKLLCTLFSCSPQPKKPRKYFISRELCAQIDSFLLFRSLSLALFILIFFFVFCVCSVQLSIGTSACLAVCLSVSVSYACSKMLRGKPNDAFASRILSMSGRNRKPSVHCAYLLHIAGNASQ